MHRTSEKKLNPPRCSEGGLEPLQCSHELLSAVKSGEIILYLRAQRPVTSSLDLFTSYEVREYQIY